MLLPDKKRKLTTNIKRKNLNPRWNETFAFEGEMSTWRSSLAKQFYLRIGVSEVGRPSWGSEDANGNDI